MILLNVSTVNIDSIIQLTSQIYTFNIAIVNFSQRAWFSLAKES